jgi:putative oxidoreductase
MKKYILIRLFTQTNKNLLNLSLLLIRCNIGVVLFVIGSGKALGWFGGMGIETTIKIFVTKQGFTPLLTYMSVYTEFIGGLLIVIGLFTRPAAFAVMINMSVATIVTLPKGFFFGGAAYPFTFFICAVIILLAGPLKFSLDALLFHPNEFISELNFKDRPIMHDININ